MTVYTLFDVHLTRDARTPPRRHNECGTTRVAMRFAQVNKQKLSPLNPEALVKTNSLRPLALSLELHGVFATVRTKSCMIPS